MTYTSFDAYFIELRWLAFRKCHIQGDAGVKELTQYISQLYLQVLAFEYCELTDLSFSFIHTIVKVRVSTSIYTLPTVLVKYLRMLLS